VPPLLDPFSAPSRVVTVALALGLMLSACSESPREAQRPASMREAQRTATPSVAAPAAMPAPAIIPETRLELTARGRAERWIADQGLAEHAVGPAATVGIGSASTSRSMAADLAFRQNMLRSAELDACAAIVRARGARVAAAVDSSGSSVISEESDAVMLRGASIVRTEEVTDDRGDVHVAVVVRVDPAATTRADAPHGPEATPAPVVEHLAVAPAKWPASIPVEQLARNVGARRVAGPDGVPKIIGFGQAEVRTPGGEAMAQRRAEMDALSAIRMFIDRQVASSSTVENKASRATDGKVMVDSSCIEVSGTSSSPSMTMPPSMKVFQWRTTGAAGRTTVGVVMLSDDARPHAAPDKSPAPVPAEGGAPPPAP
jgi:hypothetical protein